MDTDPPKEKIRFCTKTPSATSNSQLEADCHEKDICALGCDGNEWSAIPAYKIWLFDIEAQGQKGHFPDAKTDPCIQIATEVRWSQNTKTTERDKKPPASFSIVYCLKTVALSDAFTQSEGFL